jgi:CBS domain-containing protein
MSVATMMKGHELFQSLSFEEIEKVSTFSVSNNLERGDEVFRSGILGSHFFVLLEGEIHLRLPAKAHETSLVVGRIDSGGIFGLSPLLGSPRFTTTAVCHTKCTVFAVEVVPFRALLEDNSQVGLRVMSVAANAYFTRYVETLKRIQNVVNDIGGF